MDELDGREREMTVSLQGQHDSISVWITDDDDDDVFLIGEALQSLAIEVSYRHFGDGVALLEALGETSHSSSPLPQLILLDLNMPRLGGFETLAHLKSNDDWQAVPVVILTTSDNPADQSRGEELGARAFLTKPPSFDELVSLLDRALRSLLS